MKKVDISAIKRIPYKKVLFVLVGVLVFLTIVLSAVQVYRSWQNKRTQKAQEQTSKKLVETEKFTEKGEYKAAAESLVADFNKQSDLISKAALAERAGFNYMLGTENDKSIQWYTKAKDIYQSVKDEASSSQTISQIKKVQTLKDAAERKLPKSDHGGEDSDL